MTTIKGSKTIKGGFDVFDEDDVLIAAGVCYTTASLIAFDREGAIETTDEMSEEIERSNLMDDLCETIDPSDMEDMTTEELRAALAA